ncbi:MULTISPECIES: hypothetical protein [Serratia]|uniref:hypothetical protein n=1 Tax=Serratia TaxID=613 RepID=UPI000E2DB792|nr:MULTISPECIES: hypothetical protein [Serratia]SVK50269.1 Uncharacterised protein [Acinetobacter baumannii]EJC0200476.1 hypothetical protein [Serratia marcescens]MBE4972367.1 hypothetical protein [Serratia sp. X3]MBH3106399.1 hypothetical protein [Serratia ureilytica]MBH3122886.1 hypothetical protein [Serratia ureilytica]
MGAFIAFSTQDSLWGQILFTFLGILVGGVLIAAICKTVLPAGRTAALSVRLLIFVALMLAILKYNQQVMSAVNAPAELIGFLILPGFLMGYLGAAAPGRLALAIELCCFAPLAALLILGTAGVGFFAPYHLESAGQFTAKAIAAALSVAVVLLARKISGKDNALSS